MRVLFIFFCSINCTAFEKNDVVDVAIIGAGVSGTYLAYRISKDEKEEIVVS